MYYVLFNKTNKYVMCKIHYTAHSIHNNYSILCIKYTMGNILCTINNETFTMHNILCTVHYSIYIIQYSLCIKKYRIYTVYWALKQCSMHNALDMREHIVWTIHNSQFTKYSILYYLQYVLFIVQCAIYYGAQTMTYTWLSNHNTYYTMN